MINLPANQIASEYDAIFAACLTEDELAIVISGIDFAQMNGALVAYITASADNAINRIRRGAPAVNTNEKEFNRIASAARGTVRFERFEDYVIIAHCTTVVEASVCGWLPLTSWYAAIYCNDALVVRADFDSQLTYQALNVWISASIVADMKKKRSN